MNKIDKIFKITSILLLFLIVISIIGFVVLLNFQQLELLIPIVFAIAIISSIIIPIGNLVLIIIFFVKLFSKNKTKKDNEQLTLNLINIIFYSLVSIFCFAFLFLIFASDGINS